MSANNPSRGVGTKHIPERTCIGCRGVFPKGAVVRIVAGTSGAVLDYREKLPGRAAYVCPSRTCIEKAFSRDALSRALKLKVKPQSPGEFTGQLAAVITEKIKSLIAMSAKAGKLAAGYSAVQDSLEKDRVEVILFARDISSGTKEKVVLKGAGHLRSAAVLTRDELGGILNRELVGVVAIEDKGLADAVWKETERLKSLINTDE
jgi:predicted RNA-binding protein YlxR (DUF448 family)